MVSIFTKIEHVVRGKLQNTVIFLMNKWLVDAGIFFLYEHFAGYFFFLKANLERAPGLLSPYLGLAKTVYRSSKLAHSTYHNSP